MSERHERQEEMYISLNMEKIISIEEFVRQTRAVNGATLGLVAGRLVEMLPVEVRYQVSLQRLAQSLSSYVALNKLGKVYSPRTPFLLDARNPTCLAPDVGFVRAQRLPQMWQGLVPVRPDLALEIFTTELRQVQVLTRLRHFQQAEVCLVWVINPHNQTVLIYNDATLEPLILEREDELDGENIVPGFKLKVADLFD